MSQNKYITISMIMCLVLCGVLCFLGTPLLKAQADSLEYTYEKVRHNADYEPTSPVVIPEQYDNYNSYGTFDHNGLWTYIDGSFALYESNFNIWDETWTQGSYSTTTGVYYSTIERFCSLNYISIHPSYTYYAYIGTSASGITFYYDSNYTFLGTGSLPRNNTFTTPSNAYYMQFQMYSEYGDGTEYNQNISIYNIMDTEETLPFYTPYIGNLSTSHYMYFSNSQVKGLNNCADYLTFIRPSTYVGADFDHIQIYWLDGSMNYLSIQYVDDSTSGTSLIPIPTNAYYIYYSYVYDDYDAQDELYDEKSDFTLYSGYSYSAQYMSDFYDDLYDYAYDLGNTAGLDEGYSEGYDAGYEDGTSADVDTAYSNGYNTGYSVGYEDATETQTLDFATMITGIFNNIGDFLSIEIFPGITIALIIGLPLLLGAFLIILKLIRG